MSLSIPEIEHLLTLLHQEKRRGEYYGPKGEHERRQRAMMLRLEALRRT
jgi:hypothetical protein